jgi:Transcriptional regulator
MNELKIYSFIYVLEVNKVEDKKSDLYNCGKELFGSIGFKDTNVCDITKMAGMAVGSFYKYYQSKEKLFLEIFQNENVLLKQSIMKSVDFDEDPIMLSKKLLLLNINGINSNPILKEWYNRDVFSKIEQQYREDNGADRYDFLYGDFANLIVKWQTEGKMRKDIDSELIMSFFTAIINIDTHKEEIGLQYFPEILDYLTEFVMKGLMDYPK